MKKNGPHRSQSRRAFPGSSLYGFGNTTSFRLLTILDRSRFTVSQTGSVSVFGAGPNPVGAGRDDEEEEVGRSVGGTGRGTDGTFCLEEGGRLEGMKGEGEGEDEIGMEARGGLGGRAGRTVAGPDWTLALIRFSISSMSDWDEGCKGMVSLCWPCDIFDFGI